MGRRKYLPLTLAEVREILVALQFSKKRKIGSHEQWERVARGGRARSVVTVDEGKSEFDDYLVKSMISQSNFSRDEFYGATKRTARRAGLALYVVQAKENTTITGVPAVAED